MANTPVVNFHFLVEWGGSAVGFSQVNGLNARHEILEYRSGASQDYATMKVPGLKKFSNIVLKRGALDDDNEFFDWFKTVGLTAERRDITIQLLNHNHEPVIIWKIRNAWPVCIEFAELNALKSEILIESLEIAYEGLTIERK